MNPKTQFNMFARWKSKWSRNAVMISLLAHGAFIALALSVVAIRAVMKPKPEIEVTVKKASLPRRELQMKAKPQELQKASARPQMKPRMVALAPSKMPMPVVSKPPRDPQMLFSKNTSITKGMGKGMWGSIGIGPGGSGFNVNVPKLFSGRCNPQDRFRLLRANGAGPEVDESVTRALDWFKENQNDDGSWGDKHETAMTGMALLAFMGRCETLQSKEYGQTVAKAIDFLVNHGQDTKGRLWGGKIVNGKRVVAEQNGNPYEHGIATLALAEAYSITKLAKIKPVLEDAVKIIIEGQSDISLWHYGYRKSGADLSVAGWQIQALKATKLAGVNVGGLDTALRDAVESIRKLQAEDGSFPYQAQAGKEVKGKSSITGIGLLCSQMLDVKPPRELMSRAVDHILEKHAGMVGRRGGFNFYTLYYDTYGIFLSGDRWEMWNELFREPLMKAQSPDGSWSGTPPKEVKLGQAKEPVPHLAVLDTAFGTLMLEVYYRYLPSAAGG